MSDYRPRLDRGGTLELPEFDVWTIRFGREALTFRSFADLVASATEKCGPCCWLAVEVE